MNVRIAFSAVALLTASTALAEDASCRRIESEVLLAARETAQRQACLTKSCRLTDYAAKVRRTAEGEVWADALEAALASNEVVVIPARPAAYLVDRVPLCGRPHGRLLGL